MSLDEEPKIQMRTEPSWQLNCNPVRPWAEDPSNHTQISWLIEKCIVLCQICGNLLPSNRKLIHNSESTTSSSFLIRDSLRLLSTKIKTAWCLRANLRMLPDVWELTYECYSKFLIPLHSLLGFINCSPECNTIQYYFDEVVLKMY